MDSYCGIIMLVTYQFICSNHGMFLYYFDTKDYPDRKFPKIMLCPKIGCRKISEYSPAANFTPDNLWSGKKIEALGLNNVTSKSYLKRYLKTEGISQLTDEEYKTFKHKDKKTRIKEHLNRPDIIREREKSLSESLDGFGVIDGVK